MAGIVGYTIGIGEHGNDNPYISAELNELTEVVSQFDFYDLPVSRQPFYAAYDDYRLAPSNRWTIASVQMMGNFFDDFYNRIHISPSRIDLGTVANTVTREVSVWNAYTTQSVQLDDVLIANGAGIFVEGDALPYVFTPLV
jgi:hypothetical protein